MLEHNMEKLFMAVCIRNQWCDEHYARKAWDQRTLLNYKDRKEYMRKLDVLLTCSRSTENLPKAKIIFHELAGFVNDHGAMQRHVSEEEIENRRLFREEVGQSVDEA
jgi:hypothetical protein